MEARVARSLSEPRPSLAVGEQGSGQLLLVLALVLALRLPFLNQAVQGDDDIYLKVAAHALVDPLHPTNTTYVFRGVEVDLRGQPHPPLDGWVLAGLVALFGDVKEVPFHAAYILFSLIAAAAMWSLARRFSPQPLWAALLFVAVPAFVVNGNSFETDLPFLAFWMAAVALFVSERPLWSVLPMVLAAMTSYQAVFLIPILAVYVWLYHRRDPIRWAVIVTPALVVAGWQLFERLATGALPAQVLGGYLGEYQGLSTKVANAAMLFIHSWWIVFPALVPGAILVAWRGALGSRRAPDVLFLLAWIGIFFCCAAVAFPAGAARYLLPMAAPVVLLASRLPRRWVAAGFAAQLALALGLAAVNYQHWDGVRRFAERVHAAAGDARVWVNGEHGLRFYCEHDGALPLTRTQTLRPGDILVTSELSRSFEAMAPTVPLFEAVIRPAIPLRLIGLESHSGYSTVQKGFWPFGISTGAIDRLTAVKVVERQPTLSYLPMNAPEANEQIVSGIYDLEDHRFRWMSRSAVVVLKSPGSALPLRVEFSIPANAPVRRVTLRLDGREVASETYPGPGEYTLAAPALQPAGASAAIQIQVDKSFSVPGDRRELGIVLTGAGFRQ
ncbi:MAG: ArnT family glycosyltransferase [Bryobacteraceae bacterium]